MSENDSTLGRLSLISRGAVLYFGGKITLDALGFLLHFALTRGLGAGLYGIYAYGKTVLTIALVFTNLGSDKSLLKYLPQYTDDPAKQRSVFGLAAFTSFLGGGVVAVALFILAPLISELTLDQPQFVSVLRLFSLLLVFDTFGRIIHTTFRSLEQLEYEVLSNKIGRPTFRLVAVLIALGLGSSLIGVMIALLVASVLTLGVGVYLLYTRFELRPPLSSTRLGRDEIHEYYNFSIPLTLQDAGKILMKRVDVLMIGFFFSSDIVGVYNISVLLAGVLALPLSGFNQLFPPIASRLYSNGEIEEINSLYKTITRWIFTISLIMAIGTIIYRQELLRLFGENFTAGTVVLTLFVVGQLFNCVGGANGYLLMMTGHQYVLVANQWIFGVLNVILNYFFILELGFVGAAMATAGVLAILNVAKTLELWYLEGLFPYSLDFVKPILAGIVAAGAMYALGIKLDGIPLLLVGGMISVGVYALVLVGLGIKSDDREFFREIIDEQL
jgi:O-antigen/teichoic acid export membrane protein